MGDRNLISEALEFLPKSNEERIEYCKKDHWIGYPAAIKLIDLLKDKFWIRRKCGMRDYLFMETRIMARRLF